MFYNISMLISVSVQLDTRLNFADDVPIEIKLYYMYYKSYIFTNI